ncbi:MAG: TraA [Succinivibrionaceae bacterium]|nr:TraA [Succinivibrionaceae bacterium]
MLCDASLAGDQGTEFDDVWNTLLGWAQGTLGKIIALSMMLVGIIAGVARQSIMAFAMGIAAGLGLFYAPGVINGVVSAQLPAAAEHADVIMTQLGHKAGGM